MSRKLETRIAEVATAENAARYHAMTDKFVFCLDLLDLSLGFNGESVCDYWVERLESRFDSIIAESAE